MQVTIEELNPTERRLAVEVPAEDVRQEIDHAYSRLQRSATIKGFRPGRVPRVVLERYFGDQVRADVLSHLIEHTYAEAIENSGLKPVSPPEIVPESVELGRPLRYRATIEIEPAIEIRQWQGLTAKRPRRPVTGADVEQAVEEIRQALAELRPVSGREEVVAGDFVSIDYVVSVDRRELPGVARENRLVEVGGGSVPPEIDQGLVGMKSGGKKTIEVVFPQDYPDREFAGRTAVFDVTVRGIREKVVPPSNDDLAKEHGECETLAELRLWLRERLEESFRREAEEQVREQLIDEILRRHPFDVPKSLLDRQAEALLQGALERGGAPVAKIREDAARWQRLRAEVAPRAERQVRAALALDALAREQGISISDDELDAKIEELAERAGEPGEKLRAAYREPAARDGLRERMLRERVLDRVLAEARIEDVDGAASVVAPAEQNR